MVVMQPRVLSEYFSWMAVGGDRLYYNSVCNQHPKGSMLPIANEQSQVVIYPTPSAAPPPAAAAATALITI